MREEDHLKDPGVDGNTKMDLREVGQGHGLDSPGLG